MSKTTIALLVVAGVLVVGVGVYLATQGRQRMVGGGGPPPTGAAGWVTAIGSGLTGLTATVVGAAEDADRRSSAAAAAEGEASS